MTTLAACGGGSGGSGGGGDQSVPFVAFSETAESGTVVLQGQSKSLKGARYPIGSEVLSGGLRSNGDVTAKVAYRDDLLRRLAIRNSGADVTVDVDNGGRFTQSNGIVVGEEGRQGVVIVEPGAVGAEYQTFGSWVRGGSSPRVGVGSFGARTGAANMPTAGQARYRGESTGFFDGLAGDYATASRVEVTTDFSDVRVVSTGTQRFSLDGSDGVGRSDPRLDFDATGTVSGDGFSADISNRMGTGSVDGQFYGPNAEEVGGTFATTGSGGTYIGAFGAN